MAEFKIPNFGILQCEIPRFLSNETKIIGTLGNGALGRCERCRITIGEK